MFRRILAAAFVVAAFAGVSYAGKSGGDNTAHCKRFYAEINKGNLAIIDELVSDKFVEHEEFPGLASGKEGLRQFFTMMRAAFPDLTFDVDFYMADGDKVAAYLTLRGTHKGEFMGMKPTGNTMSVKTIDIIRLEGGKAVEHWGVSDTMSMMQQLGGGAPQGQ